LKLVLFSVLLSNPFTNDEIRILWNALWYMLTFSSQWFHKASAKISSKQQLSPLAEAGGEGFPLSLRL
jgi:hypothetical protein